VILNLKRRNPSFPTPTPFFLKHAVDLCINILRRKGIEPEQTYSFFNNLNTLTKNYYTSFFKPDRTQTEPEKKQKIELRYEGE
jgi:hypothetical protein